MFQGSSWTDPDVWKSREVPLKILHELVGESETGSFFENHFRRRPFALPSRARRFENLVCWDLLREIFEVHSDCWLPCQGRLPSEKALSSGMLTYEQAREGFASGRTVLIRHAERSSGKIADVARSFQEAFRSPIDVQLYVTPAGQEGFDWHYDIEDVFVIQSAGEKEFRLLPNTVTPRPLPVLTPENQRFTSERKTPEIRCWLKAGDWLYVPAGYWHKAKAVTDSFHLSVGVLLS